MRIYFCSGVVDTVARRTYSRSTRFADNGTAVHEVTPGEQIGMLQEFKDFAVKGNVVDLAIGVIIGAALGKIVGSVVDDLIMPLAG